MTVFRLGAFYRDRLNLNGDFMNLSVLAKRLNWRGFEVEVLDLTAQNTADELALGLDFALIGHGSAAAWASIFSEEANLTRAIKLILESKIPTLAVASGFETLADLGLIPITYERVERVSKFALAPHALGELLGYENTDTNLPTIANFGSTICTLLHGPFLAKNALMADQIIDSMIAKRFKGEPTEGSSGPSNANSERIDRILAEVWKLEVELANE